MKYLLLLLSTSLCSAQVYTVAVDKLLPATYAPWGALHKIYHNANYSATIIRGPGFGNDLSLWCWNNDASQTTIVPLTSGVLVNVAVGMDFAISGTNFVLAGGKNGSTNTSWVYEYGLNNTTLPTTATLLTNFAMTGMQCSQVAVHAFTNGAFAVTIGMHTNDVKIYVQNSYKSSAGAWTNYAIETVFNTLVVDNDALFMAAGEMVVDHSWWLFINKDSAGAIWAAQFLTSSNSNEGLFFNRSFLVVDNHNQDGTNAWGLRAPYGEVVPLTCLEDMRSNRLVVAYNNNNFTGSPGGGAVSDSVALGFDATHTNGYILNLSSNKTYALGENLTLVQESPGTNIIFGYWTDTPNNTVFTNSPWVLQTFIESGNAVTQLVGHLNDPSTTLSDPYRNQYVMKLADAQNHLLIFQPQFIPLITSASTFVSGRVFLSGRLFIK